VSPNSKDFITVDLRGMKPALVARARANGVGLSTIVRSALARELEVDAASDASRSSHPVAGRSIKVSVRLTSAEATQLATDASAARLSRGAYLAGLVSGVTVGAGRRDHVAALNASCAELATVSRNLRHLATLLGQGSVLAAREYSEMLASLKAEVRRHLWIAAEALSDLSPRRAPVARPGPRSESGTHHG
jgi:hypothetical protein